MSLPEYLEIPEAADPRHNFRASVALQGGGRIRDRDICLQSFLELMGSRQFEVKFDEHPYIVTRFDVDLAKQTVKLFAKPSRIGE